MKVNGKKVQRREKLVGSCKRAAEILEQSFPPGSTPISSASVLICIQQVNNIRSSFTLAALPVILLYSSMLSDSFFQLLHTDIFSHVDYAGGSDL